jgi:hypothetical protein
MKVSAPLFSATNQRVASQEMKVTAAVRRVALAVSFARKTQWRGALPLVCEMVRKGSRNQTLRESVLSSQLSLLFVMREKEPKISGKKWTECRFCPVRCLEIN